jgi:hypothetical protein
MNCPLALHDNYRLKLKIKNRHSYFPYDLSVLEVENIHYRYVDTFVLPGLCNGWQLQFGKRNFIESRRSVRHEN